MLVLGIHSSFSSRAHDSSSALVLDGEVIACAEEERFNRKKSSVGYPPIDSIKQCLDVVKLSWSDIDYVVSDGITYPGMKEKIRSHLTSHFGSEPRIELVAQSDCHSWGSFFHSGFKDSLVFDIEGVGDGVATRVSRFTRNGSPVWLPSRQRVRPFRKLNTFA